MEEKIYFEPSTNGSKNKRKNKNKETNSSKKKIVKISLVLLLIIMTIIMLLFLLRGNTVTTGHFPEIVSNESLDCSIENYEYKFTNKVKPKSSDLKITMVFYGDSDLASSSLKYTMVFEAPRDADIAEPKIHSQFANNLGYYDLEFGAFANKFTLLDNNLVITLHGSKDEINSNTKDFFCLEVDDGEAFPVSLKDYRENYENQGFTCNSTTN